MLNCFCVINSDAIYIVSITQSALSKTKLMGYMYVYKRSEETCAKCGLWVLEQHLVSHAIRYRVVIAILYAHSIMYWYLAVSLNVVYVYIVFWLSVKVQLSLWFNILGTTFLSLSISSIYIAFSVHPTFFIVYAYYSMWYVM